jgi:dihydrofolate synthase/folylpolyglutamate synthase
MVGTGELEPMPLARCREAVARIEALIDPAPTHDKTPALVRARAEMRLARLRSFLAYLGNPQDRYPIVHVGGTSGKGSTSTAIAAILTAAGYRTGLHTSPYLQVATEKLSLDGRLIAGDDFAELVDELLDAVARWSGGAERLTYGEIWFALVAAFFARQRVDVGVIEVGAGGRFDLTNVVKPAVSVITSIGLDHVETLGGTIPEIAWHKAGIIKPGAPVVTAVTDPAAFAPIAAEAKATGSAIVRIAPFSNGDVVVNDDGSVSWRDASGLTLTSPMAGRFQATNGAMAVAAVRALGCRGLAVADNAMRTGLLAARLPGRVETVQMSPRVILDGAHNAQKIGALVDDLPGILRQPTGGKLIVVLGVLEAKDHRDIVGRLVSCADELVLTRPRVLAKPGADPRVLEADARWAGFSGPIAQVEEPAEAIAAAIARADAARGDVVLVTGSLYLVGNVRRYWYPDDAIVIQQTPWPKIAPDTGRQ